MNLRELVSRREFAAQHTDNLTSYPHEANSHDFWVGLHWAYHQVLEILANESVLAEGSGAQETPSDQYDALAEKLDVAINLTGHHYADASKCKACKLIAAELRRSAAEAYKDAANWLRHRNHPAIMNPDTLEHLAKNIEWRSPLATLESARSDAPRKGATKP